MTTSSPFVRVQRYSRLGYGADHWPPCEEFVAALSGGHAARVRHGRAKTIPGRWTRSPNRWEGAVAAAAAVALAGLMGLALARRELGEL